MNSRMNTMEFLRNIRSRQKGFTLIESLAAMTALLMITAALFWILLTGKTFWQASVIRSYGRQEIQMSLQKIESELQNSNAGTITNNTSGLPVAFGFLSANDSNGKFIVASDGSPVWQKYVIFYIPNGTQKLVRRDVYGSYKAPLTQSQLIAYCDGTGITIANTIAGLTFGSDTTSNSSVITLTSQNKNQHGKTDRQTLTSTIYMRN